MLLDLSVKAEMPLLARAVVLAAQPLKPQTVDRN